MDFTGIPLYLCHKVVGAAKIIDIVAPTAARDIARGQMILITTVPGFEQIPVDPEYLQRHKPEIGGYFIVYADGYLSYSPAEAFKNGYRPLDDTREAGIAGGTSAEPLSADTKEMLLKTISEQAAQIKELELTIEELCKPPQQDGFVGEGIGAQIIDKDIEPNQDAPTGPGTPDEAPIGRADEQPAA